VRRDTCPAVAKTMERSLRLLFATRDLSEVRANICDSFSHLHLYSCLQVQHADLSCHKV